jgi:uncharacterized protein (TIGR02271 family)
VLETAYPLDEPGKHRKKRGTAPSGFCARCSVAPGTMASTTDEAARLRGTTVIGVDGRKLGTVEAIYVADGTDRAAWAAVRSGLFGTSIALVPLAASVQEGDELRVPFDREQVRNSPHHDPGPALDAWDEADLLRHYGLPAAGAEPTPPHGAEMTRSEEHLRVGTETREVTRARLRKHVVTEYQQVTVPVSREVVQVEYVPVDEAADGAAALPDEPPEVTLHAERPVVSTETVPVERVRLGTETVQEQQTVTAEVRREEIEVDTDGSGHR